MRQILLPIAMAAMIWSACTKSEFPDMSFESPVFSVSIESDSLSTVDMTAGKNGVYLFTQVKRGLDEVLVMSGSFADSNCPTGDCPGSLRFEFRNEWQENFVRPDTLFLPGLWPYTWLYSPDVLTKTVAIRWVSPDGVVLRSDIFPQLQNPDSIYFNVLKSESWENNELGDKTWKMDVNFACQLVDSMQTQVQFVVGSGVIAVAYR